MEDELKIKLLFPVVNYFNIPVTDFILNRNFFTIKPKEQISSFNANTKNKSFNINSLNNTSKEHLKAQVIVNLEPDLIEYIFQISKETDLSLETQEATVHLLSHLLNNSISIIKDDLTLAIMTCLFICSKVRNNYTK